jgi:hypothetical protein
MNQKRIFLFPIMQFAAGLGWIGGTFAQPAWPILPQILLQLAHYLPLVLLFICAGRFLTTESTKNDWGRNGLILLDIFVKGAMIAWIVIGFTHFAGLSGPNGFNDWFPIGIANAGSGLLLGLLITRRDRPATQIRPAHS